MHVPVEQPILLDQGFVALLKPLNLNQNKHEKYVEQFHDFDVNKDVFFLPRHGRGHKIPPSEINYRANIDAFKRIGVSEIISLSAVGSLKESLAPGTFVIVDQFIDRTFSRKNTFFGSGFVAHVSMAEPVCSKLGDHLENVGKKIGISIVRGGTYLAMEGPQFSSFAESQLYRSWKCDVIGMTNMPEAKLAREAEICYASVSMVTDYDCWHESHESVSVEQIINILKSNAENGKKLISETVLHIKNDINISKCKCKNALENAIITSKDNLDKEVSKRLSAICYRILNK